MRFVNAELARLGREPIGIDRIVDTLALARRKHPGQQNSLDALCDRYRIDRSRRVRHGALLDAEILVEIYCELTGGRQRSLAFGDTHGPAGLNVVPLSLRSGPGPRQQPRIDRELASVHARYVRSLGDDAIWFRYLTQTA
jgi:DNA polymerase-3 subunit epsilon